MYYTRSNKQLDSVPALNSKDGKTLPKNDEAKKKNFTVSGRAVLRSKNVPNRKSLCKSGKNIQIAVMEKNKPVAVSKTLDSYLQMSKQKGLDRNKSCIPTVINKENIINPKILGIIESNYKTKNVQVVAEHKTKQAVLNKRHKDKSNVTNKEKANTECLKIKLSNITSKCDENQNPIIISVAKENTDNFKNQCNKSLNINNIVVPKQNPVWKMCLNDNQKNKKRPIDIYDITEDEELKKEGFSKKKKVFKKNIPKLKKIYTKKNIVKPSHHCKVFNPVTKSLSSKHQEKLLTNTTASTCSNTKNVNNSVDVVEILDEVTIIDLHEQNTEVTPVKETQHESKENSEDATIINSNKQIHRAITPVKKTQPDSKQISNVDTVDPNKQIHRELTPVREIPPNSEQALLSILNKNQELDTREKISFPPLTSTPESDVFSSMTPQVTLGSSFFVRMSEIPAIPTVTKKIEADGFEEELLYSNKPTCSPVKISLFESPIKIEKLIEKPPSINLKHTKSKEFVKNNTKNTSENVTEHKKRPEREPINYSLDFFDSPAKKRNDIKSSKNLETSAQSYFGKKEKKARKSYDNRDKIRVNIASWKKTGDKEKSASEKKEEELVKTLNEHFSDLENFELCID